MHANGWHRLDDFCRASGLTRDHVARLVATGRLTYVRDASGRAVGFYDDAPPSEDELRIFGYPVRSDYDPETLTSYWADDEGPVVDPDVDVPPPDPRLVESRGATLLADFCAAMGADPGAVGALIESGELPGLRREDGRAWGFLDEELPSSVTLRRLGVRLGDRG